MSTPTTSRRLDTPPPSRRGGARRFRRAGAPADRAERTTLLQEGAVGTLAIRSRDRVFRTAVTAGDVVASLMVVGLCLTWVPTSGLGWTALVLPLLVPLVHAGNGVYARDAQVMNKSTLDEAPVLFRAAAMTSLGAYLVSSGLLKEPLGAKVVAFLWVTLGICIPACRVAARAVARGLLPPERCLVVGDNERGLEFANKLEGTMGLKTDLVGVVPLEATHGERSRNGRAGSLSDAVQRLDVHRVVIVADAGAPHEELEAIQAAKALGVKVSVLPRVLEVVGSSASFDFVDGFTVLGVPRFGISRADRVVKRAFDLAGSLIGVIMLGLPMVTIALAVKLTSRGPVFFRQTRIGRGGHAFEMLKFRSMVDNAEQIKDALRDRNEQQGLFKIADDPRITRVGRFLRRTSLDELPQILNVIRGEMSLVGPRPLVPEEDRQIQGWHRRRLHLTPGMTGPWQVLGSSRIPMREMVTIDYLYVANWSLWNDVKILLRTVATVVARRGR